MEAKVPTQALACDVASAAALALLDDEPCVEQAPEVVASCWRGHVGLTRIGGTIHTLKQALLEGDHEPVGPIALLDELLEEGPAPPRLGELLQPAARLLEVSLDAELHPRSGVPVWLVAAALNLLKGGVV